MAEEQQMDQPSDTWAPDPNEAQSSGKAGAAYAGEEARIGALY